MTGRVTYYLVMLLCVVAFTGCGSLKTLHEYTSASASGASNFQDIDYSFQQSCLDRCHLTAAREFSIERDASCPCEIYQTADSITQLIYNAVASYLIELNALSSNDLTTYNLDALQLAISYGDYSSLHIDDKQANAYMSLTRILLHTTNLYQTKKLKQFISEADPSLQILLEKLQFILGQNIIGELNFKKESVYAYYKEMSKSKSLSDYEKSKLVQDYYDQVATIQLKQQKITTLIDILKQIASGHQYIYTHLNSLSTKKVKQQIHGYAISIDGLMDDFNHLK